MSKPKVLIIGSGGREHALAWRCASEGAEVIVAPGSAGIAAHARIEAIGVGEHAALVELARREGVDVVIVGPEQPLVDGLADQLRAAGVPTLGPSAAAAELEGSKAASKAFMAKHGIPTAKYVTVSDLHAGIDSLSQFDTPPVVKASGLAAGKGVTVADTFDQAKAALEECMGQAQGQGRFGEAGSTVVLEQRLQGQEASFFVLTDGTAVVTFAPCQDHKRIGDGDTGENTGGMGAYGPAPICDAAVREKVLARIVEPTLAGLREEGRPFVGILFVGLMIDAAGEPWVIEYNVRFGDPETQPLMLGLAEPVLPHLIAAARGELQSRELAAQPACTVVMASAGYPRSSQKGVRIAGLESASEVEGVQVFHAGTRYDDEAGWQTNGGRVLGVCARGETLAQAVSRAYSAVDRIEFEGAQVRRDIAAKALGGTQ